MVNKAITLNNENGLHMRPGRLFVQEAKKHPCKVMVNYKGNSSDAKSLVHLLKLGIGKGQTITLSCDGEGEEESLKQLEEFISKLDG